MNRKRIERAHLVTCANSALWATSGQQAAPSCKPRLVPHSSRECPKLAPFFPPLKRSGHSTPALDRAEERTRSPRAAPGGGCLRREGRQTSAQLAHPATRSLDPRASRSCCLSSGDWPGPPAKRTPTIVTLQRDLQLEREKHRRTQESVEQLRMEMQMMARLLAASREQLVSLGAETLSPDMSVLMPQAVRRHPVSRTASPQPAP